MWIFRSIVYDPRVDSGIYTRPVFYILWEKNEAFSPYKKKY